VDPNELMSSYMQEVQELAAKAEEAKKQLKQLTGSSTSSDGAVTVTVNAAGALQQLTFGARADQMSKPQLAALVISTARRAQLQAAQQVTPILAPLIGEDSDAMRFVREQIPVPPEPEPVPVTSDQQFGVPSYVVPQNAPPQPAPPQQYPQAPQYQQAPQYAPPRMPQPPKPQRQAPQERPDEDDFASRPVTREEDW
jgi:DNA-binding protein YbaB